jgi:AcrR family transcriptional regulator
VSPRPYRSPHRNAAATQTRERIVAAAAALLGASEGISGFSLEAVAKKAGVTRLTVYNQFGSRRALLEAVFDQRAARGGLHRIAEAMAGSDPNAGLVEIIGIFCDFWSFDPGTLGQLHAAGASDPEFDVSVRERNERRRHLLAVLVDRMAEGGKPRSKTPGDKTPGDKTHGDKTHGEKARGEKARRDLVDVLFALTSLPFFSQLTAGKRTHDAACHLIQVLASDAVRRTLDK